jgi:hypothetical protein
MCSLYNMYIDFTTLQALKQDHRIENFEDGSKILP